MHLPKRPCNNQWEEHLIDWVPNKVGLWLPLITHGIALHDMGSYHPESPARLRRFRPYLEANRLLEQVKSVLAEPAPPEQLTRAHPAAHVARIPGHWHRRRGWRRLTLIPGRPAQYSGRWTCRRGNYSGPWMASVKSLLIMHFAVRPARPSCGIYRNMGFCLFNNVAVGVKHAPGAVGLRHIWYVDFDVHHGNGTVDILRMIPQFWFVQFSASVLSGRYMRFPND